MKSFRAGLGVVLLGALQAACGGDGSEARSADAVTPAVDAPSMTPATGTGSVDANGVLVLDDLDDADALFTAGGVSGEWFTYSDGTSPITPPDHTGIGALDGEAHVTGSGFSDWGAGLSAYFRSVDLTAFDGFRLRARGIGTVVIEVATPATSPADEGGTCVGSGCFSSPRPPRPAPPRSISGSIDWRCTRLAERLKHRRRSESSLWGLPLAAPASGVGARRRPFVASASLPSLRGAPDVHHGPNAAHC